jgi:hypothetical protein
MNNVWDQYEQVEGDTPPTDQPVVEEADASVWDQYEAVGPEPVDTVEQDAEIADRLGNIKVAIGPWEAEETTWADVIGEDATAGLVGLGAGMSDTWRGAKQIFGIDAEEEAVNEALLNELYASEEYGTEAMGGLIAGAIADPAGLAVGAGAAKAVQVTRVLNKMNKVKQTAIAGAIVGGAQTGSGYVDEEGMLDRTDLALLGATLGGGLGYWAGKSQAKAADKVVAEHQSNIRDLEMAVGNMTKHGDMDANQALRVIREDNPELVSRALKSSQEIGERPDLLNAGKNYELNSRAAIGDMPVEAVASKLKTEGKSIGSFDKVAGVISSQVKKLNPRVFGRLRKYDANMSTRPEKFRAMRESFANYFPTATSRRTGTNVMSNTDIEKLNHHLINGKFKEARTLLRKKRGSEAVKAFDDSLKVYEKLGDELVDIGALDKKIPNYWHRSINMEMKDEFMEVLKKDMGKDIQTNWEKKLKELNAKAVDKRGYALTEFEEAKAFEGFVFGARPETYSVGALKQRKFKTVPQKYVKYYTNPVESMDAYIHTAISEIEKAKFFGREIYRSGMTRPGDFNLNSTLDNWRATDMLKGMNAEDQQELVDIINLRFGRGMSAANQLTQNYKSIVNMTLLGNPISAITQFGDLGVSMYKNGIMRTAKHFVKNLPRQIGEETGVLQRRGGDRLTIEDLGLEQRFQEFEDMAKKGQLNKWQDRLFTWSGFSLVDRIGKEALVNGAVEKAAKIASDASSPAYKSWASELRRTIGEADFLKLQKDLVNFKKSGSPEDITDDIISYAYSKLADVQPISKSEVPQMYLSSNIGRGAYTLKSFMIKQLDVLRNDVIREGVEGSKVQAVKNLLTYTTLLGMMNLGADEVKALVSGKKSLSDLPEEAQALSVGTMLLNIYGSTFKTFGFSGYTMKDIASEGATGYVESLIPPMPVADELVKIGMRAIYGDEDTDIIPESVGRRLIGQVPLAGRVAAERVVPREEEASDFDSADPILEEPQEESVPFQRWLDDGVEGFKEGGEVQAEPEGEASE